jgi:hypothetical protein
MTKIKDVSNNLINSDKLFYTFLRSGFSSQSSGILDMLTGFALFALVGLPVWLATAIGAVAGGVLNCVLNYRFTFRATNCPWKAVIIKYIIIWCGSMILNSGGTEALYYTLSRWHWLDSIGFKPDGYYAAARLIVSILVSWFWNFLMQRYFVYRPTRFDPTAIRIMDFLRPSLKGIHHNLHHNNKS